MQANEEGPQVDAIGIMIILWLHSFHRCLTCDRYFFWPLCIHVIEINVKFTLRTQIHPWLFITLSNFSRYNCTLVLETWFLENCLCCQILKDGKKWYCFYHLEIGMSFTLTHSSEPRFLTCIYILNNASSNFIHYFTVKLLALSAFTFFCCC